MKKLSFDDVLELIGDGRLVRQSDVISSALSRTVWVAEWHIPGCLSESQTVCCTKREAIESALSFAQDSEGSAPRGMRADLLRYGRSDKVASTAYVSCAITTINRVSLSDLLA